MSSERFIDRDDAISAIVDLDGKKKYRSHSRGRSRSCKSNISSDDDDNFPSYSSRAHKPIHYRDDGDRELQHNVLLSEIASLKYDLFGTTDNPGILRRLVEDCSYIKAKLRELENTQEILSIKPPKHKEQRKSNKIVHRKYDDNSTTSESEYDDNSEEEYKRRGKGKNKSIKAQGSSSRGFSASIGYVSKKKAGVSVSSSKRR